MKALIYDPSFFNFENRKESKKITVIAITTLFLHHFTIFFNKKAKRQNLDGNLSGLCM